MGTQSTIDKMKVFVAVVFALIQSALAAEWHDAGIKLNTKQMACYANSELYDIMMTSSDIMSQCHDDPGKYPNGKNAGSAFCFFDKLGFFNDDEMKINWDAVRSSTGSFSAFVDNCKDSDYDTDGNFYGCIAKKLQTEAADQFAAKFNAQCPAH